MSYYVFLIYFINVYWNNELPNVLAPWLENEQEECHISMLSAMKK